jgi:hypothetical protein
MRWDPADDAGYMTRTRAIVADLAPRTGRGVYVNMLNFGELGRVVEALDARRSTPSSVGSRPDTTRDTCSA